MSNVTPITAARRMCGEVCSTSGCDQSHGCAARKEPADAKAFPASLDTLAWADDEPELSAAEALGYALIVLVVVAVTFLLSVFVWALQ